MSEDKGKPLKISWCLATPINTFMEMGWHQHGFYCGSAQHLSTSWFNLGHRGPIDKSGTFSSLHTTDKAQKYAELYIDRIVCLHGLPRTIVSDRGAQFIARFWEQLQESLGTKLIRSSAYHPQTDGQTERVNQILEDMLRAYAIDCGKNWDKYLSLAEFAYKQQLSIQPKDGTFRSPIWKKVSNTPQLVSAWRKRNFWT